MLRWACVVVTVACASCTPKDGSAAADVHLIDGSSMHITELQTVQTIPQPGGGMVYVLGVPIPLDKHIKVSVTPGGSDPPCDVYLSHITRVGPGPSGPRAAEYVIGTESTCHLKAKTKYDSAYGPVQTGDDASLLRP
jgi:hypothetical protein